MAKRQILQGRKPVWGTWIASRAPPLPCPEALFAGKSAVLAETCVQVIWASPILLMQ